MPDPTIRNTELFQTYYRAVRRKRRILVTIGLGVLAWGLVALGFPAQDEAVELAKYGIAVTGIGLAGVFFGVAMMPDRRARTLQILLDAPEQVVWAFVPPWVAQHATPTAFLCVGTATGERTWMAIRVRDAQPILQWIEKHIPWADIGDTEARVQAFGTVPPWERMVSSYED